MRPVVIRHVHLVWLVINVYCFIKIQYDRNSYVIQQNIKRRNVTLDLGYIRLRNVTDSGGLRSNVEELNGQSCHGHVGCSKRDLGRILGPLGRRKFLKSRTCYY